MGPSEQKKNELLLYRFYSSKFGSSELSGKIEGLILKKEYNFSGKSIVFLNKFG